MANQAIALQARAPQADFMGSAIRNNAALINQMAQQRAAQRQTAVAEQQMAIQAAQEQREVTKAQVELAKNVAANFRDELNMLPPNDLAGAQALRQRVVETIPGWDKILPSAEQIASDPQTRQRLLMKADEIVKYSYATPVASVTMDPEGRAFNTVAGGLPGVSGAFPMQQYEMDPNAAPGSAPQAGAAPQPPKLTQPAPVAPEALDAAAQAIASGKGVNDPALRNLPPAALDEAQKRAMRLRLDTMPPVEGSMQPMAMQQGQTDLPRIVQTMMQTGFVPQSDFEAMRQAAGPEKATQLAQIMRDNGIQIVPDAAPQGGMRDGAYRPDEGLAVLQRGAPDATLEEAQYRPTGKQFVGKSPMQSPVPGEYAVPTSEIQRRAQAQRETPAEAAAKARATKQAEFEVTRTAEEAKKLPAKRQVSTIISKIRNAYEQLDRAKAIPSERRGGVANFFDYLATTSGGREVQKMFGTKESKLLTEIVSSRKLLATAIKNATGMSAQEMNSNVELQLTLDALTDPTQGYEAAISTLGTLEELYGASKGQAPRAGMRPPGKETQRGSNIDALLKKYGG